MLACTHKSHTRDINKISHFREFTEWWKTYFYYLDNGLYIRTVFLSLCTNHRWNKYHCTAKARRAWRTYCITHIALKEKLALHILTAAAIPLPSRQRQTTTCKKVFPKDKKVNDFYTWLRFLNAKCHININTSSGKAVFSGTLEKQEQLACVIQLGPGIWVSCLGKEPKKNKKTPRKSVKCKTENICTYLQIIAFWQGIKLKHLYQHRFTSVRGQLIDFKGYLLIIYMKCRSEYLLWCWAWKMNDLIIQLFKLMMVYRQESCQDTKWWITGSMDVTNNNLPLKQTKYSLSQCIDKLSKYYYCIQATDNEQLNIVQKKEGKSATRPQLNKKLATRLYKVFSNQYRFSRGWPQNVSGF